MVVSIYQNVGEKYNLVIANKSFENVAKFKYLWKAVTNQNCIREEIENRLDSGKTHYHSVQSHLPSRLVSKGQRLKYTKS
jgi:hypothetical protein